jgi:hypothetical protein
MFVGGREASWGIVIGWRFCPLQYLPMEYRIVKLVPTRRCLPPGKVIILFRHSDVEQLWDGFSTRVLGARGLWVLTMTSHHGRCLRPALPETCDG